MDMSELNTQESDTFIAISHEGIYSKWSLLFVTTLCDVLKYCSHTKPENILPQVHQDDIDKGIFLTLCFF